VIGYASFHSWGNAQGLMDAAEIVVHEIDSQGMRVILYFLAERIC